MVWDASWSVSSVYIARYTIPQLPKGVLTKQTWSLGQCKTQMEMGASPYNSKGNYSQGQVVLAQALSKGNASSYSEWISALEIKSTKRDCASFLNSLLEWSKVLLHLLTILFNYLTVRGMEWITGEQVRPRKAYWHPEKPTSSVKGQEQFHFSTITIWHDLCHACVSWFHLGHVLPGSWCNTVSGIYHEDNVDNTLIL